MILKDRVLLISGVGPGLGRQMALGAAREGARCLIAARKIERVEGIAAEVRDAGGDCIAFRADVADQAECDAAAVEAVERFGRIDALINSARRRGPMTAIEDLPVDTWAANYDVTCLGALRMAKAVLPAMKAQGAGAIVNIGTISAVRPFAGEAEYATAKTALGGLTRQLANEFGPHGIRVNLARIGYMWGPGIERFFQDRAEREGRPMQALVDEVAAGFPIRRIPTDVECARAVLFLASDMAAAITGASLDVNGGEWMTP